MQIRSSKDLLESIYTAFLILSIPVATQRGHIAAKCILDSKYQLTFKRKLCE